jgi:hypothetical protein
VLVQALTERALQDGLVVDEPSARAAILAVANADGMTTRAPTLLVDRLALCVWTDRHRILVAGEVIDQEGRPVPVRSAPWREARPFGPSRADAAT